MTRSMLLSMLGPDPWQQASMVDLSSISWERERTRERSIEQTIKALIEFGLLNLALSALFISTSCAHVNESCFADHAASSFT